MGPACPGEGNPTLKENSGPNQESPGLRRMNLAHRQGMSPHPPNGLVAASLDDVCLSVLSFIQF